MKYIAEIGWNFMGDLDLAKSMIKDAKESGATIAKFQYWNPDKLKSGPWDVDGRRAIYEKSYLNEQKIDALKTACESANIEFLVSAFNEGDAKFIKDLGVTSIKIPSHSSHDEKLHQYAASNFESIFVSLGACSGKEFNNAVEIYKAERGGDWIPMHCVSAYPCPAENANLPRLKYFTGLSNEFGYSDHTQDIITPAVAVALGARVVEKHFTSDKTLPGRDNQFALVKDEFEKMIQNCELALSSTIDHGIESLEIEKDTINTYRGRWG
jgi:sialic acid synthase SpsE